MSTSAFSGPLVAFGQEAGSAESNPNRGPSLWDQGDGLLDPRTPFSFQSNGPYYGWLGTTYIPVISAVPATLAVNNIAASAIPVAGTAFTLVSATGAGITVGVSITNAATGGTVNNLLAIDGAASGLAFGKGGTGSGGRVHIWDPTTMISRCVRIVSASDDSGGTFTIAGYDAYGYPMTQTLTGASGAPGTATTTKAFKYIASVTPAGTLGGGAITIGTTDVYGLPLRADYFGEATFFWSSTLITANTGFVAAVTTSPATATTGDVRGTYNVQSASDGTKRLQIFQSPSVANVSSTTGLVGVTQV